MYKFHLFVITVFKAKTFSISCYIMKKYMLLKSTQVMKKMLMRKNLNQNYQTTICKNYYAVTINDMFTFYWILYVIKFHYYVNDLFSQNEKN